MAEETNKEAPETGRKKKGLPAIALIAAGAIVGGAGVVVAMPAKVVEKPVEPAHLTYAQVIHPDEIAHTFNPRDSKRLATVALKFVYTVRSDLETKAFDVIKTKWAMVSDVAWNMLKQRTTEELDSDQGMTALKREIQEELDRRLFREEGKEPMARVSEVLVVRCYWQ